MAKKNNRYFGFAVLILLFVCFISIIPLFSEKKKYDDSVLDINYLQSNVITVDNSLPLPDESGKLINVENYIDGTTGYLEFEVSSLIDDDVEYEIYLTEDGEDNSISDKYVKVYLSDGNDLGFKDFDKADVPSYYDLRLAKSNLDGKLIYTGTLKDKGKSKFILRMWVADTYSYTTNSKSFSVKLTVKVL